MRVHHEPQFWEIRIGRLIIAYRYAHWRNIFTLEAQIPRRRRASR